MISKNTVKQGAKFIIVGFSNTFIDFGVLNLLMWIFNSYKGSSIIPFKTTSFIIANINSYLWNKYWTFKQKQKKHVAQEYGTFLVVSGVALGIHLLIVYFVTTFIPPIIVGKELWANVANVIAVGIGFIWNFIGYKFIVFKK